MSEMHRKVLDIEGGSSAPGARVIVWPKKTSGDRHNQLWYFDEQGIIRSALNDFALTAEGRLRQSLASQPVSSALYQ